VQFTFKALVLAVALFAMMLALQELGRRLGRRRAARDAEGARAGAGVVDGAVFALALLGAVLAGDAMSEAKRRDWVHMATFAFAIAAAVWVILDLEYPRLGFIRVDAFDAVLVEVRAGMK
jgi:hypothetical protein